MAWAGVQYARGSVTSGSTFSEPYSSSPTANNLLIVGAWIYPDTVTVNTPTDTIGNTWVSMGTPFSLSAVGSVAAWATLNKSTAANTVSFSWSGSLTGGAITFAVLEFSGISGGLTQDGTLVGASGTGTTMSGPTYTPGVTGDLVVFIASSDDEVTAINAPWTSVAAEIGDNGGGLGWLSGTTSAVSGAATQNGTNWTGAIFGIKATGGTSPSGYTWINVV